MSVSYKFVKNRIVRWPVAVAVPEDGGAIGRQSFTAEFKLIDRPAYNALIEEAKRTEGTDFIELLMADVWVGFDGVDGLAGFAPPDARRLLLDQPGVPNALFASFLEAFTGKAHEKN